MRHIVEDGLKIEGEYMASSVPAIDYKNFFLLRHLKRHVYAA
jgi:hypothetical protein